MISEFRNKTQMIYFEQWDVQIGDMFVIVSDLYAVITMIPSVHDTILPSIYF